MHNANFKTVLGEHFAAEEVQQIVDFLERGFSQNGEVVVASIFLWANEHGKRPEEVLAACEGEWERNWKYQHPDIRGNPDASGAAGMQNRASLDNTYRALGIPNSSEEGRKIPKEPLVVKTDNSTYRFGPADEKGERNVSRDGRPLAFDRCKLLFLMKGNNMQFETLDPGPDQWTTSPVESITVG